MKITEHIHALRIPFQVPVSQDMKVDRFVYVFLVYGERVCLIDTGVAGAERIIFDYLRQTGRAPGDISRVILSHSHPDHVGAAMAVREETGCRIASHGAERHWIEDVDRQGRERPVPGFQILVGGSVQVDRVLDHGDIIDLDGDLPIEVIHTPGHSPGSISLWIASDKALFTGDAVPVLNDMPIYTDATASVDSIKKLMEISDIAVLLSSWDEPRQGGDIKKAMEGGLQYLEKIDEEVFKAAGDNKNPDMMPLCAAVVKNLGLPPFAVNPLVAGSFMSHLVKAG